MNGRRTIGSRVFLGLGACVALMLVIGVTSVLNLMSLRSTISSLAQREARKTALANKIYGQVMGLQSAQRGFLIGALTSDSQKISGAEQQVQDASRKANEGIRELEPLLDTEEGRRHYAQMKAGVQEFDQLSPAFRSHIREQRFEDANRMQNEKFAPLMIRLDEASSQFMALQDRRMASQSSDAAGRAVLSVWIVVLLVAGSLAVAAFVLFTVRGNLVRLRAIAGEIAAGASQVGSASAQVSGSSQALAQGSSEQAATLEETSASTEEINSMTQKNAENARAAATETENADRLLKETDQKLKQLIESMNQINSSSERIGKIIRVIDEIAFQTNILALNAAVEAARAGEAGMGFAVVADEVRNLAQRCAQAAKDTSELIEESITRSGEGKSRLDEVANWVSRVVDNSSRIRLLANEVNLGSQEQARGIEQIAKAVSQMQQVTQSVAASAQEGASAGEQMSAQAMTLNDAVLRLKDLVGGEQESAAEFVHVASSATARTAAPSQPTRSPSRKPPAPPAAAAREAIPLDDDFRDF
jgi:methyl-accepting chemotaxis protein/methyl-accepting chemotaxis protein-1 (serine sensor receptor)